jgi:hypothetical protein
MVIRDSTISTPLPSRAETGGRCHECGGALLVVCAVGNVGWLMSQDDFFLDLTSGVEFFSQVAPMRFPSGIEAISQVCGGRPYHFRRGDIIRVTSSTDATAIDVVTSPGVLDVDGELGASLSGPRGRASPSLTRQLMPWRGRPMVSPRGRVRVPIRKLTSRRGPPRVSPWKRARASPFVKSVVEVGLVVDIVDVVRVEEVAMSVAVTPGWSRSSASLRAVSSRTAASGVFVGSRGWLSLS